MALRGFFQDVGDLINPFDGSTPLLTGLETFLPGENRLINATQDLLGGNDGFNWGGNNVGIDGMGGAIVPSPGTGIVPSPSPGTGGGGGCPCPKPAPMDCWAKCSAEQAKKDAEAKKTIDEFLSKMKQRGVNVTCSMITNNKTCMKDPPKRAACGTMTKPKAGGCGCGCKG